MFSALRVRCDVYNSEFAALFRRLRRLGRHPKVWVRGRMTTDVRSARLNKLVASRLVRTGRAERGPPALRPAPGDQILRAALPCPAFGRRHLNAGQRAMLPPSPPSPGAAGSPGSVKGRWARLSKGDG